MVAQPQFETPQWDEGRGVFKSGYLTLRGAKDFVPVYNASPATNGAAFSWWGPQGIAIVNNSLPYKGDLVVVSVPRGSQWKLSLSDVPNPIAPEPVGIVIRRPPRQARPSARAALARLARHRFELTNCRTIAHDIVPACDQIDGIPCHAKMRMPKAPCVEAEPSMLSSTSQTLRLPSRRSSSQTPATS